MTVSSRQERTDATGGIGSNEGNGSTGGTPLGDSPVTGLRWELTTWDDARGEALRAAMGAEVGPLYAGLRRGTPPPPPDPDDVVAVVLAELDGHPVATGTLRRLRDLWEIKRLYVDPSARRLGLAASTLARLEDVAREHGARKVHLQTGFRQPQAIALYEREGWHRVPVFEPYSATDGVSVCFAKELPAPPVQPSAS